MINRFFNYISSVDWLLLAFLILFLNVNTKLKLVAIALIVIANFDFKFKLKFKENRIPLFYFLIIVLSVIQVLFHYEKWSQKFFIISFLGIIFWGISLLVVHQMKSFVERRDGVKIHNAITLFFILNIIISLFNLGQIMIETGVLNPYTYMGLGSQYYMSTGDYIQGIFFNASIVNMFANLFGCFYFLYNRQLVLALLCLIISLLTTSNVGVLILLVALIILFFNHSKLRKTVAILFLGIIVVFYARISPDNLNYFTKTLLNKKENVIKTQQQQAIQNSQLEAERENKIKEYLASKESIEIKRDSSTNKPSVNIRKELKKIEHDKMITPIKKEVAQSKLVKQTHLISMNEQLYGSTLKEFEKNKYPGKLISYFQTVEYNTSSIEHFLIGSGAGRFSSKLAFSISGYSSLDGEKRFLNKIVEDITPEFKENNLSIYAYFWSQGEEKHSVTNSPFSFVNQILGEYGVIGLGLFLCFYVWFFAKSYRALTYGKIILPIFLMMLFTDYWFEDFTTVILFELMMFIDLKKIEKPKETPIINK